jgi:glutamate/tyrosine decarboxylase-like PLP-dependent enzyme
MTQLLHNTFTRTTDYLNSLETRRVVPDAQAIAQLAAFDEPLPEHPTDPAQILAMLDEMGSPATVASAGGRYFGFVTGGTLPACLAVNWLAGAWDQMSGLRAASPVAGGRYFGFVTGGTLPACLAVNWLAGAWDQMSGLRAASPVAAAVEEVTLRWLLDVLDLPDGTAAGFVTGATMANFAGLAAARQALLAREGWDVAAQGLFAAPPITVIVGDEVHVSLLKALSMLGLGHERVIRVPVDGQGRMRAGKLPAISGPTIVAIQAGNVNTGAFDPAHEICAAAHEAGAWVHVDGAFGLWAAASPQLAHLAAGVNEADSWATDAHKWLNVPYDSGLVFCRDPLPLRAAMSTTAAAYLVIDQEREPMHFTPEASRRGRGLEVWAALRSLGRTGFSSGASTEFSISLKLRNETSFWSVLT